jgi:glutamyl-tRNA synthetase
VTRRVRFAPSPTGFVHVGSARTALFNWFLARQVPEGVFILRIEDTDEERSRQEWTDGIVDAMAWLGFDFDEGPYRQSDFLGEHQAALAGLTAAGKLYRCACTAADVAARKPPGSPPGYDGYCRERAVPPSAAAAYRFRTPDEGHTIVADEIRGPVTFENALIDDFVVAKGSGAVLFSLANVVDDRRDEITHVVRGEEHLPNTPRQMMLWSALNEVGAAVALPSYAHVPVLVNEKRQKLSKRRDPVALELYRSQGFVAPALVNYLALLGWSPRTEHEKVDIAECIPQFQLGDVSHSPAFFDVKKLAHLNGEYIRELAPERFVAACAPWVSPSVSGWWPSEFAPPWSTERYDPHAFAAIAPVVQERVSRLDEVPSLVDFLFLDDLGITWPAVVAALGDDPRVREVLTLSRAAFAEVTWSSDELHVVLSHVAEGAEWPLRKAQAPVRLAVTGRTVGPPLFEAMVVLGRQRTLDRLDRVLERAL